MSQKHSRVGVPVHAEHSQKASPCGGGREVRLIDLLQRNLSLASRTRNASKTLSRYAAMHARSRNRSYPASLALVYHCGAGDSCGGLSDGLHGMMGMFHLSVLLDVPFFIHYERPPAATPLETHLMPANFDWRLPVAWRKKAETLDLPVRGRCNCQLLSGLCSLGGAPKGPIVLCAPLTRVHTNRLLHGDTAWHRHDTLARALAARGEALGMSFSSSTNVESLLFSHLFRPAPRVKAALLYAQSALGLRANVIAVHMRTQHPGWGGTSNEGEGWHFGADPRQASNPISRQEIQAALSCAAKAEAELRYPPTKSSWLLLCDAPLGWEGMRDATGGKAVDTSRLSFARGRAPIHLDKSRAAPAITVDDALRVYVELLLIAQAATVVATAGGFAKLAARLYPPTVLYEYSRARRNTSTPVCRSADSVTMAQVPWYG